MSAIQQVRRRLALRSRFRDRTEVKHTAELNWWLTHWDPVLRAGGFNPGDAPAFLDGEPVAPTYEGRRRQQAHAEVRRILHEAQLGDESFFHDKVVVDIGPGPLGFPDACPSRLSFGIEPLAERFRAAGLLIEPSDAIYLSVGAERIPLLSDSADVVLARNSLDHVDDPEAVLAEAERILRPGGTLILMFDIGHPPTPTEPHSLTIDRVRAGLGRVTVDKQLTGGDAFAPGGQRATIVATRR